MASGQPFGGVAGRALHASAIEYGTNVSTVAPPPPPKRTGAFSRLFAPRASSAVRGLAGLGMASSESYALAKQLVDMLAINDFTSANALLLGNSPDEIAEIGRKAIALGGDPQLVAQLVAFAGSTEVVEIVDTKPTTGSIMLSRPWWHYLLGALAVGGTGYAAYRKWGKR